jgi:LPXTG-motif cell wall-anchored protein
MSDPASNGAPPPAPRPKRPDAEVVADIVTERAALTQSLADLREGLDEAAAEARRRVDETTQTVKTAAPAVGGLVAALVGAVWLLRRRRRARRAE